VTDGGFRPDGNFVAWPVHDTARLTEAFRRAVLRRFVRLGGSARAATMVSAPRLALTEATRRWATLLQQIFEVDLLACPSCHSVMRLVACITKPSVIDRILTHLRTRATTAAHGGARSPPSTRGPSGPGATQRPAAGHQTR